MSDVIWLLSILKIILRTLIIVRWVTSDTIRCVLASLDALYVAWTMECCVRCASDIDVCRRAELAVGRQWLSQMVRTRGIGRWALVSDAPRLESDVDADSPMRGPMGM